MDQDKAKTPTEPTKEPAPDGGDFGELLITGMQELLGASDEDQAATKKGDRYSKNDARRRRRGVTGEFPPSLRDSQK